MNTKHLLGTVDHTSGTVRLERTLPASRKAVWSALTDPARLGMWLGPVESGTIGPDQTFVLRMAEDQTATCTVLEWKPDHRLHLTWDYTDEGPSDLLLTLEEAGEETRLSLVHRLGGIEPVQYGVGWHLFLEAFASDLAGEEPADVETSFEELARQYAAAAIGG